MKNKKYPTKWNEKEFETMTWHDNCIHSISFNNKDYNFDLILDIDYILEWKKAEKNKFEFVVAPATLTFHTVDKLRLDILLHFKQDLEIDKIEREEITDKNKMKVDLHKYKWVIKIHAFGDHENKITFESTGFDQILKGNPVIPNK